MFSFERATSEASFSSLQFYYTAQEFKQKFDEETHIHLHVHEVSSQPLVWFSFINKVYELSNPHCSASSKPLQHAARNNYRAKDKNIRAPTYRKVGSREEDN